MNFIYKITAKNGMLEDLSKYLEEVIKVRKQFVDSLFLMLNDSDSQTYL